MNIRDLPPYKQILLFILLLLPGAFLRFFHLLDYSSLPLLTTVIGPDVSEYQAHAMRILAGEILPATIQIHAPFYAFFLALLLKITSMNYFAIRLIQSLLLMILTAAPVFLLLRKIPASEAKEQQFCFLPYLAVFLLTVYPPMAVYQCELISEPLMIALSLWGLFFAAFSIAPLRKTAAALSGLFCALGAVTHPFSLLFCLGVFLFLFTEIRREKKSVILSHLALFAVPFFLLLLPISIWNSHIAGRAVLIQANSGFNYYLGNHPASTGTCSIPPGLAWEKVHANAAAEAAMEGISADSYFLRETLSGIVHQPGHFILLLLKKVFLTLNGQELTTWSDIAVLRELSLHRLNPWCFSILLLLGLPALLCGLANPVFRKRMKWMILFFATFYLSQVFFLTAGRYRLPLVVPLCTFAAFFLCSSGEYFSTVRRTALWSAVFLATALITFHPVKRDLAAEQNYAKSVLAESWLRSGNPAKAEELLAGMDHPLFNDRRCNLLGEVMLAKGDPASAEIWFRKAVKDYPFQYQGYMNCATLLLDAERWKEAKAMFEKTRSLVKDTAGMADLDYNTGRLHHAIGEKEKAKEYYRKALSHVPTHRKSLNNLGTLAFMEKDYDQAVFLFRKACRLEPSNDRLHLNLALACILSGKKADAAKELRETLRLNPESKQARFLLDDIRKN